MSRSVTLGALIMTAAVSYGLYTLSYEVQRLEEELVDYNRVLLRDREAIQVLEAEWSYLTRPEALQARANRNLQLQPIAPRQIATFDQVPTLDQVAALPVAKTTVQKAVASSAPAQTIKSAPTPLKPVAPIPSATLPQASPAYVTPEVRPTLATVKVSR